MRRIFVAVALVGLVAAACGRNDATDVASPSPSPTPATTRPPNGQLPGEPTDLFPYDGAELAVVGVAADDTLNVRSGPGAEFEILFDLGPLAAGIVATGHNRSLGEAGIWSEIRSEGRVGWANSAFLLQPGLTDDITAELFPTPADRPRAETMLGLGQAVADWIAGDDPPSDVVVVDGPTVGDLGEITVDVIGLADTSVGGQRLRIFAQPDPGGESFTVRTVESTLLCIRGVTDDGLCL